ncbi:MAG: DUF1836 domain-containing protein [Eubacteriales bacterium]|nr:DUF1836 domain-containing protein [Eubacteriales bacterium]
MKSDITGDDIPGSVLLKQDLGNVTGREFLDKIFYISDGIMLSRIREITGVDGSTLQNWVKRGWVPNTVNKKYSKDHLARILIINMLRGTMKLEEINYLLNYINDGVNGAYDIISESQLYGNVCDIIDRMTGDNDNEFKDLNSCIKKYTCECTSRISENRLRLEKVLEIIAVAYWASLFRKYSNNLFEQLKSSDI